MSESPSNPLRDRHAELVARVAGEGDRRAFAELFDHWAPRLKGLLMRTGVEAGLAEDLVQETMTVLWTRAGLYDPARASLATWLHRIARNRLIDTARAAKVRSFDDAEPMLRPEEIESAEIGIDRGRVEARVAAALADLPVEQRDLVRLAFFEERSHSEIAEATGLPLGTVKSRLRLAFGRLRRSLDGLDEAG
jgi:RNA polymerase sigma-70 factor (ECF subfamily)